MVQLPTKTQKALRKEKQNFITGCLVIASAIMAGALLLAAII
jgi:hypothetical protein